MDENEKKTRFLEDLDRVRKQISEIEEVEQEREKKERELNEEKLYLNTLLEELSVGILSVNVQGIVHFMNYEAKKKLGIENGQEANEMDVWNVPAFEKSGISEGIRKCLDSQKRGSIESVYVNEAEKKRYFRNSFSPLFSKDGSINGVMVTIEDVTDEKKVDVGLKQKLGFEKFMSRTLSRLVEAKDNESVFNEVLMDIGIKLNADRTGLFLFDKDNHLINCLWEWHSEGIEPQIEERKNVPLDGFSWMIEDFSDDKTVQIENTEEIDETQNSLKKLCLGEEAGSFLAVPVFHDEELIGFFGAEWISEQGKWTEPDISLLKEISKNLGRVIGQKKSDDTQRKANNRFCMLVQAGFEAIVILKDGIIADANHATSSLFEYKPSEYIGKDLSIFFDSNEKQTIEEFLKDSSSLPLEAMGIKKSGEVIHVEILAKTLFYEKEPMQALGIRDVTGREKTSKDIKERYETLTEVMEDTVKALATSVEFKDPFTAGHMQRVTRLACAIAEALGLSEERIQGLKVAASIHDVGKIGIPAEILSKPGELNEAERMIVEGHPKTGYDIVKNINFPWPVADIVLQHHERMDGSGYPSGLSGDKILMEARIIGVADVVEALSSRRAHRSAQENEGPIKELKKNKGTLYDPEVVNACLKIIQKKNFSF